MTSYMLGLNAMSIGYAENIARDRMVRCDIDKAM
jgi:hypothetical protein